MKAIEARRLLNDFLRPIHAALGFWQLSCLEYRRQANQALASLSWPCRLDARGFAAFTCTIGLRFDALAYWIHGVEEEALPVLGTPIHLLRKDTGFTEWKFTNATDLRGLDNMLVLELENLAVPFIERYSDLTELRAAVASSNPKDWMNLGIDQDRRANVLAAIQMVQGEREAAIKTLDDALAYRKGGSPAGTFDIRQMRARLLSHA